MDRTMLYQEQAARCALMLQRATDPRRKALIERERRDWLTLAHERRSWARPEERVIRPEPA